MDTFVLYDTSVKHFTSLAEAQQYVARDSEPATIVTEVSDITQQLSGPDILTLYNALTAPAPPVARFATIRAGAQRLWKILQTRKEVNSTMATKKKASSTTRQRLTEDAVLHVGKAAKEGSVYGTLQGVLSKAGGSLTVAKFLEKSAAVLQPPRSKEKDRSLYLRRAIHHGVSVGWLKVTRA